MRSSKAVPSNIGLQRTAPCGLAAEAGSLGGLKMTLALMLCLSAAALSATPSAIPLDIVQVVSGGTWSDKGGHGSFRVIVRNQGWEHVTSRVLVEWVTEPPTREVQPAVLAASEIRELSASGCSVAVSLEPSVVGATLRVAGSNAYTLDKCSFTVDLQSPGHYKVRK